MCICSGHIPERMRGRGDLLQPIQWHGANAMRSRAHRHIFNANVFRLQLFEIAQVLLRSLVKTPLTRMIRQLKPRAEVSRPQ